MTVLPGGTSSSSLNENRALLAQIFDDVGVMDDFVTHVNRRAVQLDRAFDDLDSPIDAGTEPARLRQQDLGFGKGRIRDGRSLQNPMIFTSNASAWPASGWLKSNRADVSLTSFRTPA